MVFSASGELIEHTLNGMPQPKQSETKLLAPQPKKEWPLWAKALKQFATPEDKGIGDVIGRVIGPENSEAFKSWHIKIFGKPCGCTGRQARLNKLYPIEHE